MEIPNVPGTSRSRRLHSCRNVYMERRKPIITVVLLIRSIKGRERILPTKLWSDTFIFWRVTSDMQMRWHGISRKRSTPVLYNTAWPRWKGIGLSWGRRKTNGMQPSTTYIIGTVHVSFPSRVKELEVRSEI